MLFLWHVEEFYACFLILSYSFTVSHLAISKHLHGETEQNVNLCLCAWLQGPGSVYPESLGILEYQLISQPSDTTQSSA